MRFRVELTASRSSGGGARGSPARAAPPAAAPRLRAVALAFASAFAQPSRPTTQRKQGPSASAPSVCSSCDCFLGRRQKKHIPCCGAGFRGFRFPTGAGARTGADEGGDGAEDVHVLHEANRALERPDLPAGVVEALDEEEGPLGRAGDAEVEGAAAEDVALAVVHLREGIGG